MVESSYHFDCGSFEIMPDDSNGGMIEKIPRQHDEGGVYEFLQPLIIDISCIDRKD